MQLQTSCLLQWHCSPVLYSWTAEQLLLLLHLEVEIFFRGFHVQFTAWFSSQKNHIESLALRPPDQSHTLCLSSTVRTVYILDISVAAPWSGATHILTHYYLLALALCSSAIQRLIFVGSRVTSISANSKTLLMDTVFVLILLRLTEAGNKYRSSLTGLPP